MQVYYTNIRVEMAGIVPGHCTRILDVGCGEGNFGQLLKEKNRAEVWGVELSEKAAVLAGEKLDRVFAGDFMVLFPELPKGYFDCIIFNDVLEHFTDPDHVLELCKEILVHGGYVVSSIPNVRYIRNLYEVIIQRDWEYKAGGILDRTHYRFFTKKSIIRMFTMAGYEVERCTGIKPTPNILARLLGLITLGYMADTKFLQFATVAKKKPE